MPAPAPPRDGQKPGGAGQKTLVVVQLAAGHGRLQLLQQALEHAEAGPGAVRAGA